VGIYRLPVISSAVPSCASGGDASSAAGVDVVEWVDVEGVDVVEGEDEAVDEGRRMSW
jgi:hypothetical protein